MEKKKRPRCEFKGEAVKLALKQEVKQQKKKTNAKKLFSAVCILAYYLMGCSTNGLMSYKSKLYLDPEKFLCRTDYRMILKPFYFERYSSNVDMIDKSLEILKGSDRQYGFECKLNSMLFLSTTNNRSNLEFLIDKFEESYDDKEKIKNCSECKNYINAIGFFARFSTNITDKNLVFNKLIRLANKNTWITLWKLNEKNISRKDKLLIINLIHFTLYALSFSGSNEAITYFNNAKNLSAIEMIENYGVTPQEKLFEFLIEITKARTYEDLRKAEANHMNEYEKDSLSAGQKRQRRRVIGR
ncbi:hypothetical protein KKB55_23280 [Myxococcota bacterium]|nr:hypothetical protein [Myxococcota bacterium]MBU1900680.1 hypothetical protein [Myxococcota bacterium]